MGGACFAGRVKNVHHSAFNPQHPVAPLWLVHGDADAVGFHDAHGGIHQDEVPERDDIVDFADKGRLALAANHRGGGTETTDIDGEDTRRKFKYPNTPRTALNCYTCQLPLCAAPPNNHFGSMITFVRYSERFDRRNKRLSHNSVRWH